jgi:hypothetical protein
MEVWLYERRLLDLESGFRTALEACRALRKRLSDATGDGAPDIGPVKLELDILGVEIRLLKDNVAYYFKLGRIYDIVRFHEDFKEELRKVDPKLAVEIIRSLDSKWDKEISGGQEKTD